jgi:hypothetical protein
MILGSSYSGKYGVILIASVDINSIFPQIVQQFICTCVGLVLAHGSAE